MNTALTAFRRAAEMAADRHGYDYLELRSMDTTPRRMTMLRDVRPPEGRQGIIHDDPMTTSLLRALDAAADVCRRCEAGMRGPPAHPDADLVRKWLKDLGDTISNAASDASNKRAAFDAVVDGVDSNGMPPPLTETVGERHRGS